MSRPVESVALICYPTVGGSGRVATELATGLAQRGLEVHLVSYGEPAWRPAGVHLHRVDVSEYPLLKYPPYDQALAVKLAELHEARGVSLFHAHYAVPHAVAVRLADQMLGGARLGLVTTLHGTDITLVGGDAAYRRAVHFGLERSDVVTAVSKSLALDTRRLLGYEGDIEVVPNFVDSGVFCPGARPRWPERSPEAPREIVHISTFRPVKRILDLVAAVDELRRTVPVRLTLVGDGPEREAAIRECEVRGFGDRLRVAGVELEPAVYLKDADLYLFASQTESFGLGVLEAMSCAVPVVGPRVGGVPEVLGDPPAGALVPSHDPAGLAAAAASLLTDAGLWRAASTRARERALSAYAPGPIVERYMASYERAMAAR